MGVAILSGVVASLESRSTIPTGSFNGHPKWESHTSGTSTPVGPPDATSPSRFIACVSREDSVKRLQKIFRSGGGLSLTVEIVAGKNLASVQAADVVLLW